MEKIINKIINILYFFLVFIVVVTTIIIIVNGSSLDFFWFLSRKCNIDDTFGYLSIALSFVINKDGIPPIIDNLLFSIGAIVAGCLSWGICFLIKKGLQKSLIFICQKWKKK